MTIVVDANESMCGLAEILARDWDLVAVRKLHAGDVAVGSRILIERKTAADYVASLADGRLFRQASCIAASAARPVLILEGDSGALDGRIEPGARRGIELAITVGFRIPILRTRDLPDTAVWIRHLAAQEARRSSRRRLQSRPSTDSSIGDSRVPLERVAPETVEALAALPGVGRVRAVAIARHVGTLSELCRLGVRDLMAIPGIGPDTAARIVDALRGKSR
jgi:ERCC4-type nuclease